MQSRSGSFMDLFRSPTHDDYLIAMGKWTAAVKGIIQTRINLGVIPADPQDLNGWSFFTEETLPKLGWFSRVLGLLKSMKPKPRASEEFHLESIMDLTDANVWRTQRLKTSGWISGFIRFLKNRPKTTAAVVLVASTLLFVTCYRIWNVYSVVYNPTQLFPDPNVKFRDLESWDENKPFYGLRPDL